MHANKATTGKLTSMSLCSFPLIVAVGAACTFVHVDASSSSPSFNDGGVLRHKKLSKLVNATNEEDYGFLAQYQLKLVSCLPNVSYTNVDGNTELSSVHFRLCPPDSCYDSSRPGPRTCENQSDGGYGCYTELYPDQCLEGYGDYTVGINTYTNQWLDYLMQQNDWAGDDMVEQYAECQQKIYADGALSYYLGPGCSTDKQRIELRSYDDPSCVVWDGGGLLPRGFTNYFVSNDCTSCSEYNEETGNYEINDLCIRLWQDAAMKCEAQWSL